MIQRGWEIPDQLWFLQLDEWGMVSKWWAYTKMLVTYTENVRLMDNP